ncbi:MIT domain-containing protein [Heracleum sosnowskyi]|uniref:MIT domain-containing protein n=1 Tax=Heracleum sosnowskyi TaxID=360622 RepID=A0AAD8IBB0_9APIA|nr:MIT domain-containing protein [Heracleum sosnowskyi]
MYSNFKEQAILYIKQAVEQDEAGNYPKKFTEYLRRLEEIREVIDHGGAAPSSNGDAAVAAQPKTKPKNGEGGYGEDSEQAKLSSGLNSAIMTEKPNVKWNDVAGLESAKQALQEAVILPVKFPQFFTGKRRPWRAFLLYGPPGTGKSHLAKAVATEADSTFFRTQPSSERKSDSMGVGSHDEKVLVLAATNTPYALDQAIRRRFDKRIYIPLPDLKARQHMFKVHLGDTPHNLTERDFEQLARKTEGFSGSDISVCVNEVLFEPVRKTQDAQFFIKDSDTWIPCGPRQPSAIQTNMQELTARGLTSMILPPPISRTDFDKVVAKQKPTVSVGGLEVHQRFTKEFGEEG